MNRTTIFILIFIFVQVVESRPSYDCDRNATCGCSSQAALISRIFGGEDVVFDSWGWAVIVYWGKSSYCSGTLLSDSWVLVRATSVRRVSLPINVAAATNHFWTKRQTRNVSHVIMHAEYNNSTLENDVALLRVNPPFDMTDPSIALICLPTAVTEPDYPPVNTEMIVIGWGPNTSNGSASAQLQQAKVKRISSTFFRCVNIMAKRTSQFCSMGLDRNIAIYPGDSGGAAMLFSNSQQWILVGIIMGGTAHLNEGSVTLYTRVSTFVDWLQSTMAKNLPAENVSQVQTLTMLVVPTEATTSTTTTSTHKGGIKNDTRCFSNGPCSLLLLSLLPIFYTAL